VRFGGGAMSDDLPDVIDHSTGIDATYPKRGRCLEYALPCHGMTDETKAGLDPWLQRFVGLDQEKARDLIVRDWKNLDEQPLSSLRDRLLEFQPASVVTYRNRAWLVTERPLPWGENQGYYGRDVIAVPPPVGQEAVDRGLAKFEFADSKALRLFAAKLGSLYEVIPNHSGHFQVNDWSRLLEYWGDLEHSWYAEWSSALILHISVCGNMLLLHPAGKVAWVYSSGGTIEEEFDSFESFIEFYTDYKQRAFPLEMY
jgi:hypothetical protein